MTMATLPKKLVCFALVALLTMNASDAFTPRNVKDSTLRVHKLAAAKPSSSTEDIKQAKDNKAMAFLKKMGKVGGSANRDYRFAMGIDEGPSTKAVGNNSHADLKKVNSAYTSCTDSGIIDDISQVFPTTSSGTEWQGFTDRVMGGVSSGSLAREDFAGRTANVLRGSVSLENNGGFIQMATNLFIPQQETNYVDASKYDGVEIQVHCQGDGEHDHESFNVHLKTLACSMPYFSYRSTFELPTGEWQRIRIPWSEFVGKGVEYPFASSELTRVGIVAIGKEMSHVILAISDFRFYNNVRP